MIQVRDLTTTYKGLIAIADVSLEVSSGEIVCVVGANGAGKSTLLKSIAGLAPPRSGTIVFSGERIERLTVMHEGRIIAEGGYEECLRNPEVRRSYWQIDTDAEEGARAG